MALLAGVRSLSTTLALLSVLLLSLAALATEGKKKKLDMPESPNWKSGSGPGSGQKKSIKHESVNAGSELKLDCRTRGKGNTKVTWFKDGQPIIGSGGGKYEVQKFKLIIPSAEVAHQGNYSCKISTSDGESERTFLVDVKVRRWPLEVEGPHNVTANTGETVRFRCTALNSQDTVTIRWSKVNRTASLDGEDGAQSSSFGSPPVFLNNPAVPEVLELVNVTLEDAGEYRCVAGNVWGIKYYPAWLSVIAPTTTTAKPTTTTTKTTTTTTTTKPTTTTTKTTTTTTTPTTTTTTRTTTKATTTTPATTTSTPMPFYSTSEDYLPHFPPSGGRTLQPRYQGGQTFFPDLTPYVTTKSPRHKDRKGGSKGKNNKGGRRRNKNRKQPKDKATPAPPFPDLSSPPSGHTSPTSSSFPVLPPATTPHHHQGGNTFTTIWNFNEGMGEADPGYDDDDDDGGDESEEEKESGGAAGGSLGRTGGGEISLWTIYTIVGTLAGVILLIGLLAITIALCCRREANGTYKSTPV